MCTVRVACFALLGVMVVAATDLRAAEPEFPFERELLLDSAPPRNLKRMVSLEIARNGKATIDLWCSSGQGQVDVVADTIKIVPGPMVAKPCTADQARRDAELLTTLTDVTTWRRDGDGIVLIGTARLRFRPATN